MEEQREKTGVNNIFIQPWKFFFWEAFLFALTLGLGIAAAIQLHEILMAEKLVLDPIPFWQLLVFLLFATLFILLVVRLGKAKAGAGRGLSIKGAFFKIIFILAVFAGSSVVLNLLLPEIFALILIVILIFWWLKRPVVLVHNLAMILGLAGVGALLGLRLSPEMIVVLLIVLSVYDFIAVYKTKHMVKMAEEMMASGTVLALIVPQKISDFQTNLKEVRSGSSGKFMILGGGDVAFPLLLCVSLIPEGVTGALIVAVFALLGLFASFRFFISQKVRRPIPALPPIALFSIIGFLIFRFFTI